MSSGHRKELLAAALAAIGIGAPAHSQSIEDLSNLSIEDLARLQVTSVAKRDQPLSEAPASVVVLTNEDILRSGQNSLPEVLRLAPNLTVQQVDARQYSISARGFNGVEPANKLLVLIDGRSIYTTLHAGIFWELHAPLVEDLDQIEVISGPGGTLYGPNAVNGVVNIRSKDARDTLGGLIRASAGANERSAALRYGIPVGTSGAVRFYATAFDREDEQSGAAADANDRFKGIQAGFRADFEGDEDHFTLQGDWLESDTGQRAGDGDSSRNLLARWNHLLSDAWSLKVQAYYDKYLRRFLGVKDSLETADAEIQVNGTIGGHRLVFGGGARTTKDLFANTLNSFVLDPESRRLWVGNVFAQDEMSLTDRLSVIGGVKAERSSFSGWEILPNLRLAWHPGEKTLLWAAISKAVRTPSRIDRELTEPVILNPAPRFQSEKLLAMEVGYRGQVGRHTSLSVTLFLHDYDDIRTTELVSGEPRPVRLRNGLEGNSYGVEAWLAHQLTPWWRLNLGLNTLEEDFKLKRGHNDLSAFASLGSNPSYQVVARSQMDLHEGVTLDVQARGIDSLERPHLRGYVEADARIGWQLSEAVELYVVGNNLLHKSHPETGDLARGQRIERSIFAGTRLSF